MSDNDATRDKVLETSLKVEEVQVKYLFSMKFYYKSKIVGVECRVKTDKGNKHVQIGNCNSNVHYMIFRSSISCWLWLTKKLLPWGHFGMEKKWLESAFGTPKSLKQKQTKEAAPKRNRRIWIGNQNKKQHMINIIVDIFIFSEHFHLYCKYGRRKLRGNSNT